MTNRDMLAECIADVWGVRLADGYEETRAFTAFHPEFAADIDKEIPADMMDDTRSLHRAACVVAKVLGTSWRRKLEDNAPCPC